VNFDRTEEGRQLADSIARFVERDYDFDARRKIIASGEGYSRDAWRTMADLGLVALVLPVEAGGFGGGALDAMPVMEAIGEALIVEPYLPTVGLGAQFIARAGTPAQKERILPAVISGDLTLAFAQLETDARYDLAHVATRATQREGGYVLDGAKLQFGVEEGTKLGCTIGIETIAPPAAEMDAREVAAALAQAAVGVKKAAGIMAMAMPKLSQVSFPGVASGEVVMADGKHAPLPLLKGVPSFKPTDFPAAKTLRFPKTPLKLDMG